MIQLSITDNIQSYEPFPVVSVICFLLKQLDITLSSLKETQNGKSLPRAFRKCRLTLQRRRRERVLFLLNVVTLRIYSLRLQLYITNTASLQCEAGLLSAGSKAG